MLNWLLFGVDCVDVRVEDSHLLAFALRVKVRRQILQRFMVTATFAIFLPSARRRAASCRGRSRCRLRRAGRRLQTGPVAERLRVREIDDDEGHRLVLIVHRGTGSLVPAGSDGAAVSAGHGRGRRRSAVRSRRSPSPGSPAGLPSPPACHQAVWRRSRGPSRKQRSGLRRR